MSEFYEDDFGAELPDPMLERPDPLADAYYTDPDAAHAAVAQIAADQAARDVVAGFAQAETERLGQFEQAATQMIALEASRAMEARYGEEWWGQNVERVKDFILQRPYLMPNQLDPAQVVDSIDTAAKAVRIEQMTTDIAERDDREWKQIQAAGSQPYWKRAGGAAW